jgi:hypothetical protein
MNKRVTFIYLVFLLSLGGILHAENHHDKSESDALSIYESSYTSIAQKDCQTLESDNLGSIQECEGFADMKVTVIEGDVRQSIALTRADKKYELNFWNRVSSGFSSLGLTLEWRYKRNQSDSPFALIVRLEVNEDEEDLDKVTSYLVVSKITDKEICVVGKIDPQANQNIIAQKMAESATEMSCLE